MDNSRDSANHQIVTLKACAESKTVYKQGMSNNTLNELEFTLDVVIYAAGTVDHEESLNVFGHCRIGTCTHDAIHTSKLKHDKEARSIVYHGEHNNGNDWAFYY